MSKSKSVLITGAGKRIGRAIAVHMASQGWNVAVHCHHSQAEAAQVVKEIEKKGVRAGVVMADLCDPAMLPAMVEQAVNGVGRLSCLVHNASVFHNDTIQNVTPDSIAKHWQLHVQAPLLLTQAFVKQLGGERGNIITMLDYCVWNLPDTFLSYGISKYALWGATQMLAKQLAPQIRVNGIGPGHSLPNERETAERFAAARAQTPLQNGADPDEICRAVDFILSSPSMTGQMLALDGGKHLVGAEFY